MKPSAQDSDISALWLIDSFIITSYTRILNTLALIDIFESKGFFAFDSSQYRIFILILKIIRKLWVCWFLARTYFLFILMTNRTRWFKYFPEGKKYLRCKLHLL